MSDVLTSQQRKYCMSRIRGKDTGPELKLRKALRDKRVYYRVKNSLPGKPDVFFKSLKVAVFVDGCFWHGCPEHFSQPDQNKNFWIEKITKNIERDARVNGELKSLGWNVVRFWEHEINQSLDDCVEKVVDTLSEVSKV